MANESRGNSFSGALVREQMRRISSALDQMSVTDVRRLIEEIEAESNRQPAESRRRTDNAGRPRLVWSSAEL